MTRLAKSTLYKSLELSRLYDFGRWSNREKVLILTYHGVLSGGSENYVNRNCVDAAMFEEQMRWLSQHYHVLSLSEILDGLQGSKKLPEYAAAVTFDDGFHNNFSVAFPILLRHNIPAAIFLTTDFIGSKNKRLWTERVDSIIQSATTRRLSLQMNGNLATFEVASPEMKIQASDNIRAYLKTLNPAERERKILALERQIEFERDFIEEADERYAFLTWDEVRLMAEAGIEFGSHTASHAILSTLSPDHLEEELSSSKKLIEAELGKPCTLFSYPNGTTKDFTKRDQMALARLGFRAAVSQIIGFNTPGENLYALKRINIVRFPSFAYFRAKISGVQSALKDRVRRFI